MQFQLKFSFLKLVLLLLTFQNISTEKNILDSISLYYNYHTDEIIIYDYSLEHNSYLDTKNGDKILLNSFKNSFKYYTILTEKNKVKEYYSKAENGGFAIVVHYIEINGIEIKVNLLQYLILNNINIDIIFDIPSNKKVISFPLKYLSYYKLNQNYQTSKNSYGKKEKKISDVYGFEIKKISKNNINGVIDKVLVISYNNGKIKYFSDVTPYLIKDEKLSKDNVDVFNFHINFLPGNFDLYVFMKIKDENSNEGNYISLIKKDIKYPNFQMKKDNPLFLMIIITLVLISIAILVVSSLTFIKYKM